MEERIIKDINNLLTQLFQKMKEAGYEWDAEKKELKKIEQKSAEWSEEDEIKVKSIIAFLKSPSLCSMDGNKDIIDENIKYLKSLKDRIISQPKQEWSEEDENYRDALISLINEIKNQPLKRLEDWDGYLSWLKSLRPQKQWKPSDEQMEALADALSFAKSCGEEGAFDLRTLYEQLNKLKG